MVSHSNGDFLRPNYAAVIRIIIFQRRLNRWKTGHNEDHMRIENTSCSWTIYILETYLNVQEFSS